MGFNEKENSLEYWDNIHSKYERNEIKLDDWLDKFETIIDSCSTPILDLGCGSGNDTLYLINKNKQVISCDQSSNAINNIKKNFPEVYDTKCFNMLDGMPFDNNSFELIIADLCLHYFKEKDTFELLNEIRRIFTRIEEKYPNQKKGIFLSNDTYANMFLNLIFQKYRELPSFYEIIGFDNSPIASEAILPITTVGQQIDIIAQTAMELLVQQMEEQKKRSPKPLEKPVHKQITPILIRRNTTS